MRAGMRRTNPCLPLTLARARAVPRAPVGGADPRKAYGFLKGGFLPPPPQILTKESGDRIIDAVKSEDAWDKDAGLRRA